MSTLPELVAQARSDPLQHAREHAARGGRAVGLAGGDLPVEVVLAAGAMPVALPQIAERPTAAADPYFEPSFMPGMRSIAAQWLHGDFDSLEAVVFSRADDSAQRAYYYLCELQRRGITAGPRPLIFDVAKIPRPTSLAHTEHALRHLAAELGADLAQLPATIAIRNRRRLLLARLEERRRAERPPSGSHCEELARVADALPADGFDAALTGWLAQEFPLREGPRVLLIGTAPPDARLHEAVERGGGCVVAEVGDHALERLGRRVNPGADPLRALAAHYQALDFGSRSFADRSALVAQRAFESKADAAVVWLIEEDEAPPWQLPGIIAALGSAGVRLLSLVRRRWDARDGALDAIASFVRTVQARK